MSSRAELHGLAIAHLDCDAFYAAIEKRDRPGLRNVPVIVGGRHRGVVAACWYIARTYGVRSAMPMFRALKACPDTVVVRPDMKKYASVDRKVRATMLDLTPLVEPLSIDEAFMDLSSTESLHRGSPAETLARLASRVEDALSITVSIGLGYNRFLAKIASDLDKPRGFAVLGRGEARSFLAGKPVGLLGASARRCGGGSTKTATRIGELARLDEGALVARYGRSAGASISAPAARTTALSIPTARPGACRPRPRSTRTCPTPGRCVRSCGSSPRRWRGG